MLAWLMRRLFRAGIRSKRGLIDLGEMGKLARSGPAVWILTQEKARLEYLAAKEAYERSNSRRAYKLFTDRFLQLQSTNAVITALINEHTLEQILLSQAKPLPSAEMTNTRRSA
ncbi:MAG TPA: hypothetical protein VKU02_20770 [Gemmataceae bacterium]|nr:hypothetical protein [Gemmataceae bacterium]